MSDVEQVVNPGCVGHDLVVVRQEYVLISVTVVLLFSGRQCDGLPTVSVLHGGMASSSMQVCEELFLPVVVLHDWVLRVGQRQSS